MIFVDSGGFIGWLIDADQYREAAMSAWRHLRARKTPCVTTDAVIVELLDYLSRHWDGKRTADAGAAIMNIPFLRVIETGQRDVNQALAIVARFHDQQFSFTDCLSFAVMRRMGVRRAFTFDRHFAVAGLEMWPSA